jgi:hypothetical protein
MQLVSGNHGLMQQPDVGILIAAPGLVQQAAVIPHHPVILVSLVVILEIHLQLVIEQQVEQLVRFHLIHVGNADGEARRNVERLAAGTDQRRGSPRPLRRKAD